MNILLFFISFGMFCKSKLDLNFTSISFYYCSNLFRILLYDIRKKAINIQRNQMIFYDCSFFIHLVRFWMNTAIHSWKIWMPQTRIKRSVFIYAYFIISSWTNEWTVAIAVRCYFVREYSMIRVSWNNDTNILHCSNFNSFHSAWYVNLTYPLIKNKQYVWLISKIIIRTISTTNKL